MTSRTDLGRFYGEWRWTLASGLVTFVIAVLAFCLPDIEWAPKGGLVGWLLVVAGLAELSFGLKRGLDPLGETAVGSGVITTLAGLIFVANPLASFLPVANVVMVWLFVRGFWVLATALRVRGEGLAAWLAMSGATDVLLALVLFAELPISVLVTIIFGHTPELIARFALILAVSFFVSAVSHVGMAFFERRRLKPAL